ncbi:MAG: hypothetical protein HC889_10160 [Synechococcaceae cyanobacterium SM1_2_3]|nr:hypothetical protein [Synechococcaceae cyanobacterium SM1_2_3]
MIFQRHKLIAQFFIILRGPFVADIDDPDTMTIASFMIVIADFKVAVLGLRPL